MMIYLDTEYKCHVIDDGTMFAYETDFFDGKCKAFIEGYRLVPAGHEWTRSDDVVFKGKMIAPWRDIKLLNEFQSQYEAQLSAAEVAYQEGVNSI